MADLTSDQACALATLTTAVSAARLAFITDMPGQDLIYTAKADEGAAYAADLLPNPVNYPMVTAEIGITGGDAASVAAVFKTKAASWTQIAAKIETARLTGERDIAAAKDLNGVNKALWTATAALDAAAKPLIVPS